MHLVNSKLDSGKIILQKKVKLSKEETPSSLQKKILKHEHILYPRAIRNIFIIFIVSGFWHGANWTFIFWGFINACYLIPLMISDKNRIYISHFMKSTKLSCLSNENVSCSHSRNFISMS